MVARRERREARKASLSSTAQGDQQFNGSSHTHLLLRHFAHEPEGASRTMVQSSQHSARSRQKAPGLVRVPSRLHPPDVAWGHVGVDSERSITTLHPLRDWHTPLRHSQMRLRFWHALGVKKPQ